MSVVVLYEEGHPGPKAGRSAAEVTAQVRNNLGLDTQSATVESSAWLSRDEIETADKSCRLFWELVGSEVVLPQAWILSVSLSLRDWATRAATLNAFLSAW